MIPGFLKAQYHSLARIPLALPNFLLKLSRWASHKWLLQYSYIRVLRSRVIPKFLHQHPHPTPQDFPNPQIHAFFHFSRALFVRYQTYWLSFTCCNYLFGPENRIQVYSSLSFIQWNYKTVLWYSFLLPIIWLLAFIYCCSLYKVQYSCLAWYFLKLIVLFIGYIH